MVKASRRPWTTSEDELVDDRIAWLWDNPAKGVYAIRQSLQAAFPYRTWNAIRQRLRHRIFQLKRDNVIPLASPKYAAALKPETSEGLRRICRSGWRVRVRNVASLELEEILAKVGALTLHYSPGDKPVIERLGVEALRLEGWLARQRSYMERL